MAAPDIGVPLSTPSATMRLASSARGLGNSALVALGLIFWLRGYWREWIEVGRWWWASVHQKVSGLGFG